jgi:hypothetical protein
MPQNNPLIPLPIPLCNPKLLKAALNVFVAEQQVLDDPRDLTDQTTAQTGFYTHRVQAGRTSSIRPGALTPDALPGRVLMNMDGPEGRHGKMRNVFIERLSSTYSSPGSGFRLIYATFVKGPHENGST